MLSVAGRSVKLQDAGAHQVRSSFGEKWKSQATWGMKGKTARFMRRWILQRYGWHDEDGYRKAVRSSGTILDAGCGLGREVIRFATANPAARVVGLELSDCAEEAGGHVRATPNATIIQGDLCRPPLAPSSFDLIFSEGVLHHTADTAAAFRSLVPLLRPGGEIAVYVYREKGRVREFCDDLLRRQVCQMKPRDAWGFSRAITQLGRALAKLRATIDLPTDIPQLDVRAGTYDVQRFIYDNIFKCFWNDQFTFDENALVNFDWYHPAYAHRHRPVEVERWCALEGLKISHMDVCESGITVRARRPA